MYSHYLKSSWIEQSRSVRRRLSRNIWLTLLQFPSSFHIRSSFDILHIHLLSISYSFLRHKIMRKVVYIMRQPELLLKSLRGIYEIVTSRRIWTDLLWWFLLKVYYWTRSTFFTFRLRYQVGATTHANTLYNTLPYNSDVSRHQSCCVEHFKYPVVPYFKEWRFPHKNLPPSWNHGSFTSATRPSDFEQGNASTAVLLRDVSCRLSDHQVGCEEAHLCPRSEARWFLMGCNLTEKITQSPSLAPLIIPPMLCFCGKTCILHLINVNSFLSLKLQAMRLWF